MVAYPSKPLLPDVVTHRRHVVPRVGLAEDEELQALVLRQSLVELLKIPKRAASQLNRLQNLSVRLLIPVNQGSGSFERKTSGKPNENGSGFGKNQWLKRMGSQALGKSLASQLGNNLPWEPKPKPSRRLHVIYLPFLVKTQHVFLRSGGNKR